MGIKEYIKKYGVWQEGPCVSCGIKGYPLSMGGPGLCPGCDCGRPPLDKIDNRPEAIEERRKQDEKVRDLLRKGKRLKED